MREPLQEPDGFALWNVERSVGLDGSAGLFRTPRRLGSPRSWGIFSEQRAGTVFVQWVHTPNERGRVRSCSVSSLEMNRDTRLCAIKFNPRTLCTSPGPFSFRPFPRS